MDEVDGMAGNEDRGKCVNLSTEIQLCNFGVDQFFAIRVYFISQC